MLQHFFLLSVQCENKRDKSRKCAFLKNNKNKIQLFIIMCSLYCGCSGEVKCTIKVLKHLSISGRWRRCHMSNLPRFIQRRRKSGSRFECNEDRLLRRCITPEKKSPFLLLRLPQFTIEHNAHNRTVLYGWIRHGTWVYTCRDHCFKKQILVITFSFIIILRGSEWDYHGWQSCISDT